jgi:hypothetical protein
MNVLGHNIYCLSLFIIIIFFGGAMLRIFALYIVGALCCAFSFYLYFFGGTLLCTYFLMGQIF